MAAAAAAMAATTAPAAALPGCIGGLCDMRALDPWFAKLARARRAEGERPLHILQIGDSHTAGDSLTGAWRDILQQRYGSGGRGVLPPGKPWRGYFLRGMTADMSDGWKISATFGPGSADPRPALGLSGFDLTSQRDGARIALTADAGQMFDRFTICALAQPRAGALRITIGATSERMNLDSAIARPECKTIRAPQPQFTVEVVSEGDPVTITSWATFRDAGGIAVSNLGVVGSQLVHFARTDDAVVAEELRTYKPDLIVLAFGTNEGFAPVFRPYEYEIVLRTQIGRLRRLSGGVPILLIGAPDASSRRPEMLRNAPGPTPASCPEPVEVRAAPQPVYASQPQPQPQPQATADVSPLAGVMARLRANEGGPADPPPPVPAPPPVQPPAVAAVTLRWEIRPNPLFPPAGLASVREVQRRVAHSLGLAFWDWNARMGGACSAVRWVKANPPMMRPDYVHFTREGGEVLGKRLQDDLDAAAAIEARR